MRDRRRGCSLRQRPGHRVRALDDARVAQGGHQAGEFVFTAGTQQRGTRGRGCRTAIRRPVHRADRAFAVAAVAFVFDGRHHGRPFGAAERHGRRRAQRGPGTRAGRAPTATTGRAGSSTDARMERARRRSYSGSRPSGHAGAVVGRCGRSAPQLAGRRRAAPAAARPSAIAASVLRSPRTTARHGCGDHLARGAARRPWARQPARDLAQVLLVAFAEALAQPVLFPLHDHAVLHGQHGPHHRQQPERPRRPP